MWQRALRMAARWSAAAVLSLSAVLMPVRAFANAISQALYAKGLIPFNAEHWDEAYQLFEEAAQADPNDALAVYYRGLTAARLGFPDAAREGIERALQLWPELPGASLDLGILYFDAQRYDEAEPWLQQAYSEPRDRFVAALFLGLSRLRRGDDVAARGFLAEAAKDPELRATAQYYDGLVLLRSGQPEEAKDRFESVQTAMPDSELGRLAGEYVQTGQTTAPEVAAPVAPPSKPWAVQAGLGFEYDSNVVLASSDDEVTNSLKIDHQSDGRAVLAAGGRYRILDQPFVIGTMSYDFSQSIHFRLTKFDLQGHRVRLDLAAPGDRIQYGLTGWYDFYALDYQSFLQQGVGVPWVTFFEGRVAATQLFYRITGQDYFRGPLDPFLDGINHAVGLRQYFLLGATDRQIGLGYRFDYLDTKGFQVEGAPPRGAAAPFEYRGHQFDVEFDTGLWGFAQGAFGYLFYYQDYVDSNPRNSNGFHRRDPIHRFLVELTRPLTPSLTAGLWYIGTIDDSNTDEFRYQRHVLHLGVTFAY
jgi:predicted negative regulator of RcsB-dependent stress response